MRESDEKFSKEDDNQGKISGNVGDEKLSKSNNKAETYK
jgi:hypothetical protein